MLKNFDDCIKLFSDDESQMTEQEKAALKVGCMKVLNVISNPTIILNNDFDIMFANKAFLKCIDKSIDPVIGEKAAQESLDEIETVVLQNPIEPRIEGPFGIKLSPRLKRLDEGVL